MGSHVLNNTGSIKTLNQYFVGGYKSVQVFTADGTWTKPVGINRIVVEVVGGGGGGGGSGTDESCAGGGGGGGYSCETIDVTSVASVAVTVGTGGTGGTAGNNPGNAGNTSSFGAYCSATGGGAGTAGNGNAKADGGTGSGGDINIAGGDGSYTNTTLAVTGTADGRGGSSIFAPMSSNTPRGNGGFAGNNYGGGGGGGCRSTINSRAGGDGADGIVVVWEYEQTQSVTYGPHALLDGLVNSDTVAQTVTRGSLIYGNSTPKWDELVLGSAGQTLRSNGTDAGWAGGAVLLNTATASTSATIDFTLPSGYFAYVVMISHLAPVTDNAAVWLRTSTDGGSTYDSGASDYIWMFLYTADSALTTAQASGDAADAQFILAGNVGNSTNETFSAEVLIMDPSASKPCTIFWDGHYATGTPNHVQNRGWGRRYAAADVNAIRFVMSTGNIASGAFRLYGLGNA